MNVTELSKDQLIELTLSLLEAQEMYYKKVRSEKMDVQSGFYQLAGYIQHIRERFDLPKLY
jgi:hypothetical protein